MTSTWKLEPAKSVLQAREGWPCNGHEKYGIHLALIITLSSFFGLDCAKLTDLMKGDYVIVNSLYDFFFDTIFAVCIFIQLLFQRVAYLTDHFSRSSCSENFFEKGDLHSLSLMRFFFID
jgi:hypothetical protein